MSHKHDTHMRTSTSYIKALRIGTPVKFNMGKAYTPLYFWRPLTWWTSRKAEIWREVAAPEGPSSLGSTYVGPGGPMINKCEFGANWLGGGPRGQMVWESHIWLRRPSWDKYVNLGHLNSIWPQTFRLLRPPSSHVFPMINYFWKWIWGPLRSTESGEKIC